MFPFTKISNNQSKQEVIMKISLASASWQASQTLMLASWITGSETLDFASVCVHYWEVTQRLNIVHIWEIMSVALDTVIRSLLLDIQVTTHMTPVSNCLTNWSKCMLLWNNFIIIMLPASYPHTLHPSLNSHPHSTPHLTQHTPSHFQGAPVWSSGKSSITWPLCWNGRWGRGCVWTTLRLYFTIFFLRPTTSCRWTHRPGRVRRGRRERKKGEWGGGRARV